MIKVKDQYGKEISGLYRGKNGSLVIKDDDSYSRYKRQKHQHESTSLRIQTLENEISDLKMLLTKFLDKYENDK